MRFAIAPIAPSKSAMTLCPEARSNCGMRTSITVMTADPPRTLMSAAQATLKIESRAAHEIAMRVIYALFELEIRFTRYFARVVEGVGDDFAEGLRRVADRHRGGGLEALQRLGLLQRRDQRRMQLRNGLRGKARRADDAEPRGIVDQRLAGLGERRHLRQ